MKRDEEGENKQVSKTSEQEGETEKGQIVIEKALQFKDFSSSAKDHNMK